ncbi:MAG: tRNA pseudouridine(55) synthase TruB, partial [Deltaproteobacteria bacterium]|nr:tRNA pseudouridine(55) synthase TruB [Deltaproteobacteria bacterium]
MNPAVRPGPGPGPDLAQAQDLAQGQDRAQGQDQAQVCNQAPAPESPAAKLEGLFLADKPSGPTSFDICRLLRRLAGQKSTGHIGTLDPLATGLLGVLFGRATALAAYLHRLDKTYLVTVTLGLETDTDDAAGRVTARHSGPWPEETEIEAALRSFLGPSRQVPPAYSAIKISGRPAYQKARRGEKPDLAARPVLLNSCRVLAYRKPRLVFRAEPGAGFSIRSLARDLGRLLGCGGTVQKLRREAAGPFTLAQASPVPQERSVLEARLLSPAAALAGWPEVRPDPEALRRFGCGQAVRLASEDWTGAWASGAWASESWASESWAS